MPASAPYNFVPLSRKVVFPESDSVSHEMPFRDGISGTLDCEIETSTPVYVRNGVGKDQRDLPAAESFFKVGNDYMIPGTSLKGMLRAVLEIASFGKTGPFNGRERSRRYAVRDLTAAGRDIYGNEMTEKVKGAYKARSRAGWLTKDDQGKWFLQPCSYARVEQRDLKNHHRKITGKDVDFSRSNYANEKYKQWQANLSVKFDSTGEMEQKRHKVPLYYDLVQTLSGNRDGLLVFTGQPGPKKHMEFVFFAKEEETPIDVTHLKEDFVFIHSEDSKPNPDWEYWKSRLDQGESVPVFYLGDKSSPTSLGLAMMYRLPYKLTIADAVRNSQPEFNASQPDMAETIFGYAGKDKALKGRVSISHALADRDSVQELPSKKAILGNPKPTYYPNYMKQTNSGKGYKTLMDSGAELRGRKRYPVRPEQMCDLISPAQGQENVSTSFRPLAPGAKFRFRVRVHNLRPFELGALVWVMTWGGNTSLRHSLGMAKSAGYGQSEIRVIGKRLSYPSGEEVNLDSVLGAYTEYMGEKVPEWLETEQMVQLCAMADPSLAPGKEDILRPMQLKGPRGNDFQSAKKESVSLPDYVEYHGKTDEQRFGKVSPQKIATEKTIVQAVPAPTIIAEEVLWGEAVLSWTPNNSTLKVVCGEESAILVLSSKSERTIVPEILHKRLFDKKKSVQVNVTIKKQGNSRIIVGVEELQT